VSITLDTLVQAFKLSRTQTFLQATSVWEKEIRLAQRGGVALQRMGADRIQRKFCEFEPGTVSCRIYKTKSTPTLTRISEFFELTNRETDAGVAQHFERCREYKMQA